MNKKRILIFAAAVLITGLFSSYFIFHNASAQVGISLFPIKFRVTIEPGKSYTDTITVINPNDFPIGVKPEVENISGGEEGSINLYEYDVPYGLMAWIQIDKTPFTLEAQERRQMPFSINIPLNGEPGGHYGAILFRGIPPPAGPGAGSAVGISGRVGSVILVEVPGDVKEGGEIYEFKGPSYVSRGPVEFTFKVKNTGNTHFDPTGAIIINGLFVKETKVAFEPRVVFPGFSRTFKAAWPVKYAFGPIKATAEIEIPGVGKQLASISFFAFPWQEGAGAVLILLIIFFGIWFFKKKFKIVKIDTKLRE